MEMARRQADDLIREGNLQRDRLINEHLPHVKHIVRRIAAHIPPSVDIDDLITAGIIGLIEAVDRYDPTRDNKFMTYATFRIRGAVLSELRSRDFLSRLNRRKFRELQKAYFDMEQKLGREVNDEEVAEELGLDLEELHEIKTISSLSFIGFEEMGYSPKVDKVKLTSYLANGATDDVFALTGLKEVEDTIAAAMEQLPEKEKLVISLYYWDELTMKEIGKVLDITESRVSQIHSQAIIHLRGKFNREGLVEI